MRGKAFVVLSDLHTPFHSEPALDLALEYIKRTKPSLVILNGDIMDCYAMSRFNDPKGPRRDMASEVHVANAVLDDIQAAAGKAEIMWGEGNHELRLPKAISIKLPDLNGLIDLAGLLNLHKRGIKWLPVERGDSFIMRLTPKLAVAHGWRYSGAGSNNVAKLTLNDWGGSIIVGHNHSEGTHRERRGDGSEAVALVSGCLCQAPLYRTVDRWSRGFIAGDFDQSGRFQVDHVRIGGERFTEMYLHDGTVYAKRSR